MALRGASDVLFKATKGVIEGKPVVARVLHIEKPQSLELQGFREGVKFLSIRLAGVRFSVDGKTQSPLVAIPCRFESYHRHQSNIIRTKSSQWERGLDYCFSLRSLRTLISETV